MTESFEKKTTETLAKITKKLSEHDKHFADHDAKFDRVFKKLLDHDDKFERIEDKIKESEDRILEAIDSFAKKTTDVETEQLSTSVILARHEDEIIKIKKVVKIA